LKLELVTSLEQFEGLGHEWNSLLADNATNEIFLTWQWQHTWWQAYHPGDLWTIVGRDESGTLIGIAPWFVEQPSRVVRTIGCVEVTDYLDVLVMPEQRESFLAAVADCAAEHADAYSRIVMCNVPQAAPTLDVMPRLLAERGFAVRVERQEVCPVITLPSDFEAYLMALDKKNRQELRRKVRRAESGESDKVDWYMVGPQHDLDAELDKFLKLMAASHPSKKEFLADPQNVAFFKAIVPIVARCGWLQLSFLTVNGAPAASYLNFDYNGRILVYNSGLIPETYAHLSPGIVLLVYNIQYAIEHGRRAFDFLRGNEDYKYRLGGHDQPVMALEATR